MKFIFSIVFLVGIFFSTSLYSQNGYSVANAILVDLTASSTVTLNNVSSQNSTGDARGSLVGQTNQACQVGTCCSTLVYKVLIPQEGALYVKNDNYQINAGGIVAYNGPDNASSNADLSFINTSNGPASGNRCTHRDSLFLGRGCAVWDPTPFWYDKATWNESTQGEYSIPAGTYYIHFWNYKQSHATGVVSSNLTFEFFPYCIPNQPEIEVEGNSVSITDGDDTPSTADDTDLGTILTSASPISKTFTIKNVSANPLDISNTTITGDQAANFTITNAPTATVAANSSTTMTVQFTPNTGGLNTATIAIANTDCDKALFNFDIKAFVIGTNPSNVRGNMIEFNGTSEYVNINEVMSSMEGATEFTIEAWINADASQTGNDHIVSINRSNGDNEILFYLDDGKLVTYDGSKDTYSSPDLRGTGWHHVVLTHDNSHHRVYLDGVLLGTKSGGVSAFTSSHLCSIGQEYDNGSGSSTPTGDYFHGKMDEIRIWNDVRTEEEIRANMNRTFTIEEIESNTNLKAYFQFNNDEPASTADGVKNILGNHGTSVGGTYSASEVAVGGGISAIQTINAAGTYDFSTVGVELTFTTSGGENIPNGNIVITKITTENPEGVSTGELANKPTTYWVIRNLGTNNTGLNAGIKFKFDDGQIDDNMTVNHKVHKRESNQFNTVDWTDLTPSNVNSASGNNHITVNVTSFSQFSVSSSTSDFQPMVLPVELIHFDAQRINNHEVNLTWSTATEINNHGFEIERMDGNSSEFKSIGWVTGNGNTAETSIYKFEDNNSFDGRSYYRLKQIDGDGVYDYSEIISVSNVQWDKKIKLYPNPTNSQLTLQNANGRAVIFNTFGQPVMELQITNDKFGIDVSNLPIGHYVLQILSEDGQRTIKRFVKN